nr:hypothetical protein [Tanacetum cinerariifolium]GFA40361.1 hypothetical protein [Tanacetum cinerariifolium]
MGDNLFTCELGVVKDFYFLCVEQSHDEGDLSIYEGRACYDENDWTYAEAVILIDKRL